MLIQSAQKYWLFHPNVAQNWYGNAILFKALVYDAFAVWQVWCFLKEIFFKLFHPHHPPHLGNK